MDKFNVDHAQARIVQATLPGFPAPVEEEEGRSARRRALFDRQRAQRACAPMGTLSAIVASQDARKERHVWYVIEPDPQMAPHYAALGLDIGPGRKVLVDAESLRPVAMLEFDPTGTDDFEASTPCGFNPYWDLPPT